MSTSQNTQRSTSKVLLLEFWGLGDSVFLTGFLHQLEAINAQVTVVAKPGTKQLLERQFPGVNWEVIDAPWTAFVEKYRLWKWPWLQLAGLIRSLRYQRFDVVASVRRDPRDHFIMFLSGARRRIGIPRGASRIFLSETLPYSAMEHRVETWSRIAAQALKTDFKLLSPTLPKTPRADTQDLPRIMIHVGARIAVRRWPLAYWKAVIQQIKRITHAEVELILEPDGFGVELGEIVDRVHSNLSIDQLVELTARSTVFLCNDSGPAHIAAAVGVPVFAIFGPTKPEWFRPYGPKNHVAIRDICDFHPCFDYCKFPEPYCLTRLEPEQLFQELGNFLSQYISNASQ